MFSARGPPGAIFAPKVTFKLKTEFLLKFMTFRGNSTFCAPRPGGGGVHTKYVVHVKRYTLALAGHRTLSFEIA